MTDIKLKPCPFCGGRHIETAENLDLVYCFDCGAEMHTDLGGSWNNRPIEDALHARITELEAERRWIPVSERLPKDCELVWVRATNSPHNLPRRAFYTYRNGKWVNDEVDIDNVYSNLYVTHWMPLPVLSEVEE